MLLVASPVAVVKHLDEDNEFCISCHLHEEAYRGMVGSPARTLAAAHYTARHHDHPERCFTCHSGEGVVGWTAVTALSAVDAARWVLGDRHETTVMRLPIEDRACIKCHADDIRPKAKAPSTSTESEAEDEGGGQEAAADQSFHQIRDHRSVRTPCVACHTVHSHGERPRLFLTAAVVQSQCRNCHPHGLGTER